MAHAESAHDAMQIAREEHVHLPTGSYKATMQYGFNGSTAVPQGMGLLDDVTFDEVDLAGYDANGNPGTRFTSTVRR